MRLTDFTAFTGEICLYMSVVGFFLSGPGGIQRTLVCAAVSLLAESACMLCRKWRGAARYLPALLMIPLFLTARSIATTLLPAPALMLILLRCYVRQWRAEYYTVRRLFVVGSILYSFLFLSFALNGSLEWLTSDSLPFFVTWLLLTVLNMRLLRNQYAVNLDGRFKALNIALLLCVAFIGMALSSDLPVAAAAAVLKAALVHVVWPVLFVAVYIIAVAFAVIAYLIARLLLVLGIGDGEIKPLQLDAGIMENIFGDAVVENNDPSQWLVWVVVAVGILIFLVIAWIVVRELISRPSAESDITGEIKRESLSPAAKQPRRAGRRASAGGVRAAYRKYLALCAAFQIPVDGSVASDVIRDKSAPYMGAEDAGELRDMWLSARFSGQDTSPEETKRARQLLRRMRESSARAKRTESSRMKRNTPPPNR